MRPIQRIIHVFGAAPADPLHNLSCALKKLWGKIHSATESIFARLAALKSVKNVFSTREITLIDRARTPQEIPSIKDREILPLQPPHKDLEEDPATICREPPYVKFDDSLEEMRSFLRDFSNLCVDTVFENQISDQLEAFQNVAPSLPPVIKSFAKLIIEIGDKAAKPIFQKFSQQKAKVIDPTLQKIFKTLLKPDSSLPIEEQEADREKLYETLLQKITQEFSDHKVPPRQNLQQDYVKPILAWLLLSDHSVPLAELFGPGDRYKEDTIDQIFERSISILVERKIDQYAHLLERTMQRRLNEITHQMLRTNASRMADFLSERLSELVATMPFTEMFDTVTGGIAYSQLDAIIAAENALEEHRQLLDKAKRAAVIIPKKPAEAEAQRQAKLYLESVAKHGSEEAFLRDMLIEKYGTQAICNVHIKQMIDQEIALTVQGTNPVYARTANEKAIFSVIAENILDLMMTTKKTVDATGAVVEVDPFTELWDRLYFPDELKEVLAHASELFEEFITPETTALLESIKAPMVEITKSIFTSWVKDILKKQLVRVVQTGFNKIIDPESLDELSSQTIIPAMNRNLLGILIEQEVGRNLAKFTPLFHAMVEDPANRSANAHNLQAALIKHVKSTFRQFDPESFYAKEENNGEDTTLNFTALTDHDWLVITKSLVEDFEGIIMNSQINGAQFDAKRTSAKEVKDILLHYFQESSKDNNPIYGEIAMNILFKAGNLPHEGLISYFIKDVVSAQITSSVKNMRADHRYIIDKMSSSLKESLLNPQRVKELLSDTPQEKPKFRNEKLAHQINVTARLAHEMIIRKSEEKGSLAAFGAKKVLTDNPGRLNELLSRVYKKTFGERFMNENLLMTISSELFRALGVASEHVRVKENLRVTA